jgi:hypothetical protein
MIFRTLRVIGFTDYYIEETAGLRSGVLLHPSGRSWPSALRTRRSGFAARRTAYRLAADLHGQDICSTACRLCQDCRLDSVGRSLPQKSLKSQVRYVPGGAGWMQ